MKKIYLTLLSCCLLQVCTAQSYSLQDLEAQFLQENSLLIASKFQIDEAEAKIIQEKLWANPNISVNQVNLWSDASAAPMPLLFGNYGRTQQIAVALEQLIETAGKRSKRVAIKELEKKDARLAYIELMRELKKQLRLSYFSVQRLQQEELALKNSVAIFEELTNHYERQADLQNIAKADFFRIQTALLALQKEQLALQNQQVEALQQLVILTQNPKLTLQQLSFPEVHPTLSKNIPIPLKEIAMGANIGLKRQINASERADSQLLLEKAQRMPNLNLELVYDRGGSMMQDFFGIGVAMDLPIFNTNKGNIQAARFSIQQQQQLQEATEIAVNQVIDKLINQLQRLEKSMQNWPVQKLEAQNEMISNYKQHLQQQQVTLLEFIDFTQAYREAQQGYFELQESYQSTYEELQYVVGEDF